MARLTLLRGPAGAGKSQRARELLRSNPNSVLADTSATWALVGGIERDPETGLYPVRLDTDPRLDLARYVRRTIARHGLELHLDVVATTSDSAPEAVAVWRTIAEDLRSEFVTETLDPGRAVVEARLIDRDGVLSPACADAVRRWYG